MAEQLTPEGRKAVTFYNATELQQFLVEDAVKRHATWLPWAVAAYTRIGQLTGKGAEVAINDVLDEVLTLTGDRALPLTPPPSEQELNR